MGAVAAICSALPQRSWGQGASICSGQCPVSRFPDALHPSCPSSRQSWRYMWLHPPGKSKDFLVMSIWPHGCAQRKMQQLCEQGSSFGNRANRYPCRKRSSAPRGSQIENQGPNPQHAGRAQLRSSVRLGTSWLRTLRNCIHTIGFKMCHNRT